MKIIFLGVGEAFDENTPNNSHLVITEKTKLLLDCGMTAAPQVWKYNSDQSFLDAVYISHWHADHYFGLPGLLLRMWEGGGGGRTRSITVVSGKGFKQQFEKLMDLAYLGFRDKFNFEIKVIEVEEGDSIEFQDLRLSFAKTVHSGENLAIRIGDGKNSAAYSGDGSLIAGTDFYKNLDMLILETYLYNKEIIGHSSIVSGIKFAKDNNAKCLALTHINRDFRKNELAGVKDKIKSDKVYPVKSAKGGAEQFNRMKIIIPEPMDEYNL